MASVDLVEKVCVVGERIVGLDSPGLQDVGAHQMAARHSLPAISVESIKPCVLTEDRYSQRPPDIATATHGFQGLQSRAARVESGPGCSCPFATSGERATMHSGAIIGVDPGGQRGSEEPMRVL